MALLVSVGLDGYPAFTRTEIAIEIDFQIDSDPGADAGSGSKNVDCRALIRDSLLRDFPSVESRSDIRALTALVSGSSHHLLAERLLDEPELRGSQTRIWFPADDEVDMLVKGSSDLEQTRLTPQQLAWVSTLQRAGDIRTRFNSGFFTSGDSRDPELAGIGGAIVGTVLTMIVTLLVSFPFGVATAIYLEEFTADSHWTRFVEINVNNLAAVPSIVFGLLGLALFLGTLGMPRSAPLVGGATLALMTLPVIIIASRAQIQSVPLWIREAARGVGASPLQVVIHHVVPLAMPGIITGTILGIARALGETAPLLMIGMVAFVVDVPGGFSEPSTVLPAQIFLWADSPERGFVEKVSGAIIVLLAIVGVMNAAAIWLRRRFEHRW